MNAYPDEVEMCTGGLAVFCEERAFQAGGPEASLIQPLLYGRLHPSKVS